MLLKKWDMLPAFMQTESVREYYDILSHKKISLVVKRLFDIAVCVTYHSESFYADNSTSDKGRLAWSCILPPGEGYAVWKNIQDI